MSGHLFCPLLFSITIIIIQLSLHTVKSGVLVRMFSSNTLGCCSGFHGNVSVKAGISWKRFDLCTQILVATTSIGI